MRWSGIFYNYEKFNDRDAYDKLDRMMMNPEKGNKGVPEA